MGSKKIKNAFVMSELFVEGQHTPQDIQKFSRSPLFPIAATIYNTVDKALRVGHIEYRASGASELNHIDPDKTDMTAYFCTPEGLTVAKAICRTGQFSFHTTLDVLSSGTSMGSPDLTTTNANYIRAKLSKSSNHPALSSLQACIRSAQTVISHKLRGITDSLVDKFFGNGVSRRPTIEFSSAEATYLADIVMGKATSMDIPPADWQGIEIKYQAHSHRAAKFDSAIEQAREAFDGDKWVFIPEINGGVMLGAIRSDGVQKALDAYRLGNYLPSHESTEHTYANFVIPLKWYPSVEALPEDYKRELDYALVMLKAHRGSEANGEPNLIPVTGYGKLGNWPQIGAFKRDSVMFLPK